MAQLGPSARSAIWSLSGAKAESKPHPRCSIYEYTPLECDAVIKLRVDSAVFLGAIVALAFALWLLAADLAQARVPAHA
jgi:hypothetical protein